MTQTGQRSPTFWIPKPIGTQAHQVRWKVARAKDKQDRITHLSPGCKTTWLRYQQLSKTAMQTKPSTIVASAPISLPPPEIRYRAKHMPPSMRPKVATPTMTPKRLAVFASLLVGSAKLLVSSVVLIVAFHNSLSTALFSRYAFAIRRHPRSIRQTCEKPKGNATYGNDCMPTSMPMRKCVDHCRASIEASTKHLIWEYLVSGNRHLHSAN